ncbi:hypothetical protein L1987_55635 [Smallanthus sonchifolius]|uniref:Uncharacterized protein n=1 Tax=Smallanthus sonchifolius TaxID=185202 RepID=A0ACB9EAI9_9ASTR|nr:hypothetical protein L1987_55635 [Smallanthus sonchifolius]
MTTSVVTEKKNKAVQRGHGVEELERFRHQQWLKKMTLPPLPNVHFLHARKAAFVDPITPMYSTDHVMGSTNAAFRVSVGYLFVGLSLLVGLALVYVYWFGSVCGRIQ